MAPRLFLDLAGALPPSSAAVEALREMARVGGANPSAPHREGRQARAVLDRARDTFQRLLGLDRPEQVVFTSGGTEAAHVAMAGVLSLSGRERRRVLASAVEHPAVLGAARRFGGPDQVDLVPCRPDGRVTAESVLERVGGTTALVAFQAANLDSGAIHEHGDLARELASRQVPWLCDVQARFGWEAVDWSALGADFLMLSAHRFGGPRGCGVLAVRDPSRLTPLFVGGRQENGLRAGTENVAGIGAGAVAAEEACAGAETRAQVLRGVQARFLAEIRSAIPGTRLLGPEPGSARLPGHLALTFEGVDAESLALMLDLRGLAVGVGSGCLSPLEKVSGVFLAMGLTAREAMGAVLFGFPPELSEDDRERIVAEVARAVARIRGGNG